MSAAESASAHRPVEQSPECEQAERSRYEFVMRMIINHDIWYLQEKMAVKSPPPQTLPARAFMLRIMHRCLKARRASQTRTQVAQHARRTRSFMMRSMQVFLTIAS